MMPTFAVWVQTFSGRLSEKGRLTLTVEVSSRELGSQTKQKRGKEKTIRVLKSFSLLPDLPTYEQATSRSCSHSREASPPLCLPRRGELCPQATSYSKSSFSHLASCQ